MRFPNGNDVPKIPLSRGIEMFKPTERRHIVDDIIFKSIPAEEQNELEGWMSMHGRGPVERYYLTLLVVAEAASRRGDISRERIEEVIQDIVRGKTARGILLPRLAHP